MTRHVPRSPSPPIKERQSADSEAAISNQQSAISNQQSAISNQQSALCSICGYSVQELAPQNCHPARGEVALRRNGIEGSAVCCYCIGRVGPWLTADCWLLPSVRRAVAGLMYLNHAMANRKPGGKRGAEIHRSYHPETVHQAVAMCGLADQQRGADLQAAGDE